MTEFDRAVLYGCVIGFVACVLFFRFWKWLDGGKS